MLSTVTEATLFNFIFTWGGYTEGSVKAYRNFASQIAARAQAVAFVLDYPLAPERPFPTAPKAALESYHHLKEQFGKIVIVGDSAGGGLALVLLAQIAAEKSLGKPVAGVVFSPWTDLSNSRASITDPNIKDPILNKNMLVEYATTYLVTADPYDPLASPLFGSFSGIFPPLLIQVGSDEILFNDSWNYAHTAAKAGVSVKLEIWKGLHHVFQQQQLSASQLISVGLALDRAGQFINNAFI